MTETEPAVPTSQTLYDLYEQVAAMAKLLRAEAEINPTRGRWGAATELESSLYDIWGAAGYLAIEEGLLT